MVCLIAAIILSVLSQLVGFINNGWAFILYAIIFLLVPIFMILNIILILDKKGKDPKLFISLIIFILFILFSYKGYSLVRAYSEVHKQLDEDFNNRYKIVGVTNYEMDNCYNQYNYAFNVKLNDDTNFVFQATYGNTGVSLPNYKVCYNYIDTYLPYYLEEFNKKNNSHFAYSNKKDDPICIEYSQSETKLLRTFIHDLFYKDIGINYQIKVYNIDTTEYRYLSSWNNDYEMYLRDEMEH